MSETIIVQFDSIDEVNALAGALGSLPYGQVFQLLDKIGKQVGPQIRAIEEAKKEETAE
jgi:hypothetical protein